MKSIILTAVIIIGSLNLKAEEFSKLNNDAVAVANLLSNPSVKACLTSLEASLQGKLSFATIEKSSSRQPDYILDAVVLQKGDIATAVVKIKLVANQLNPWSSNINYLCQAVEKN